MKHKSTALSRAYYVKQWNVALQLETNFEQMAFFQKHLLYLHLFKMCEFYFPALVPQ